MDHRWEEDPTIRGWYRCACGASMHHDHMPGWPGWTDYFKDGHKCGSEPPCTEPRKDRARKVRTEKLREIEVALAKVPQLERQRERLRKLLEIDHA